MARGINGTENKPIVMKPANNSLGEEVTEEFFESLDTSVMPSRDENGNLDLQGLLELKKPSVKGVD